MPRRLQIWLRRVVAKRKRSQFANIWPVLQAAGKKPEDWRGWPNGKQFAFVTTHDVEWDRGQQRCRQLATLEESLGFRSSFNFVPERYQVSADLRDFLNDHGFEVGVHGLNHDGKLFQSKAIFDQRAPKINKYLKEWHAVGFRSPAMHHNLEWIKALDLEYDLSTFDTDPFEPQSDGVETIFPFWVSASDNCEGYLEVPYTLPQDHAMFIILREQSIDIWKRKLDWIAEQGGMALLNTHPDYMNLEGNKLGLEEYPVDYYVKFLEYIKTEYKNEYWHGVPRELAHLCATGIRKVTPN